MLNTITIMGHITKDPELRRTANNVAVTSFTIACDRAIKNADGSRETDFIDCVAWRSTAEFVNKYLAKGRMVVIHGRLQIRTWKDKNGNSRRNAEIIVSSVYFADSKRDPAAEETAGEYPILDDSDELPF